MAIIHCVTSSSRNRSRTLGHICAILRCPFNFVHRVCCSPVVILKSICFLLFISLLLLTVGSFVLAVYTAIRSSHYPFDYPSGEQDSDYDSAGDVRVSIGYPFNRHVASPLFDGSQASLLFKRDSEYSHPKAAPEPKPYGDTEDSVVEPQTGETDSDFAISGGVPETKKNGKLRPISVDFFPHPNATKAPTATAPSLGFATAASTLQPVTGHAWWEQQLRAMQPVFYKEADLSRVQCQKKSGLRGNALRRLQFTELTARGSICALKPLFLLVIVHSKASHFERRQLIRATFGSIDNLHGRKIRLLFGLGEFEPSQRYLQRILALEARKYGDIVQGRFQEHTRNLTHNFFILMKWIGNHCPHASYIAKLDDDTFLDVGHLLDFLEYMPRRNFVYCAIARNRSPVRYSWSKWYVSRKDYPLRKFPNYCLGVGFVISGDLTPRILGCSMVSKLIPVDDVFYTGQILRHIGQQLSPFWEGHTYSWLTPRLLKASERKNFIFLASKQSIVMPMLWKKLWREILIDSLNSWSFQLPPTS